MNFKDKIKTILKEGVNKETIKRLLIFDFDGTLIDSPTPETGRITYKEKTGHDWPHKGWWGRAESLDMDIFDIKPIPSVIEAYHKETKIANTLSVMLTGRIPRLSEEVEKILSRYGLTFDFYIYNNMSSTLEFKINTLETLIEEYPNVSEVKMFEDRNEHINSFKAWGASHKNLNFHITHVF